MRRARWVLRASALALTSLAALVFGPRPASAGNEGEGRPLLRDADRPYSVVAGEADASAVVQNPANLAYLAGFNAIIDVAANTRASGRRGNGVGAFAAVPLPWEILALGVGVQALWRQQISPDGSYRSADDPYGKFSVAVALPLMRWAPGLAVGLQYSRLFSGSNAPVSRANQLDLALSWRANRFVSLALVARNLNSPSLGATGRAYPALDPEIALRPLGDSRLEFAIGARFETGIIGGTPDGDMIMDMDMDMDTGNDLCRADVQVRGCIAQPRGRVLVGDRGVRAYIEAEAVPYFDGSSTVATVAARISAGVQFDTPHFGIAVGPSTGVGTGNGENMHGVNGRVRLSHERYTEVLPVRPRRVTRISLAGKSDDRELAELVWALDELAARGRGVVLVELRGSGFGTAQLEEIREALTRFRDHGGKVVAYLDGASLSDYFLASVADRILAHPDAALSIVGLSSRTLYWGELLERIGVKAEFVRVAEYKGTPEMYSRSGPSAPVAEAARTLMTDTWNHLVRVIGRARARDPAVVSSWVDEAPWQPDAARRRGLIDGLAWPDELDGSLEAWLGRRVRIEPPPKAPTRAGDWRDPAHVAVLHIDGGLVVGESIHVPILDLDVAGSETLTKQIAALREDPDVKAVVVRIDSRGGSVLAAREISHELDRLRAEKPVVVSMGQTAASGGYYIATAGQYIFADATTQTGSIGVYFPKLDLSGLLTKVGVHAELLSIGDRATMSSYWKPYSEDERAAAMARLQATYDIFIERVAKVRAMTPEAADAVARGRVWSGVRAIEVGLVDRYGGLREAVDRAAGMADLEVVPNAAPRVLHYPPKPTVIEQLRRIFGVDLSLPLGAAAAMDPMTGQALGFADPILRTLRLLPAALWHASGPEALALGPAHVEISG